MGTLKKVCLSAEIYKVCLSHALSTEKEEVMGLLIGKVDEETQTSYITACRILARSDKQPDRVEISPEQLMEAVTYAEDLSKQLNDNLRVLGWYHSHPHITVQPSHVDLKTQAMYQNMDKYFIGIIFSVFSTSSSSTSNRTKTNEIQVTCFQTDIRSNNQFFLSGVCFEIIPTAVNHSCSVALQSLATLPEILSKEEQDTRSNECSQFDELTKLHNNALQTLQFVNITDKISRPLVDHLENEIRTLTQQIKLLKEERDQIKSIKAN